MKVELMSCTPCAEELCAMAANGCYSNKPSCDIVLNKDKIIKILKNAVSSGHLSVLEHAVFTFSVSGVSRACYDDNTEILTHDGWKLFKDLHKDDLIATRSSNGETKFNKINEFISYDYNGIMHEYKSQNMDLCVTPNHNMFVKKYDVRIPTNFCNIPSEDINVKRVYMTKKFVVNNHTDNIIRIPGYEYTRKNNSGGTFIKKINDGVFDRKTFLKFLAWYLSDGSTYYDEKENKYTIKICQTQCEENILNNTVNDIISIVKDLGFNPHYDGHNIVFNSPLLGKFLKDIGTSLNKHIPFNIFDNFDVHHAKIFIDEYLRGDGTVDKNNCGKLYTSSEKLANQLQTICFIAGYTATVFFSDRRGETHVLNNEIIRNGISYIVNMSRTGHRNFQPVCKIDKHRRTTDYNGTVYCVDVDNHVIFVRRNGVAVWCGNCTHQLVRHRMASYSQSSQRYVKLDQPDYVYPFNDEEDSSIQSIYVNAMEHAWKAYNKLVDMGVPPEDARYVLPNACTTNIVVTMNARELLHFFELRCCNKAQWEIREMADKMLVLCKERCPIIFENAGPKCRTTGCTEANPCGNPRV